MITIIAATNRPESVTLKVAKAYKHLLENKGVYPVLFSLEELPHDFIFANVSNPKRPDFISIMEKMIIPADKFVVIVPEYNGSIPGILKAFIDVCDIESCFYGKKAAFVGVASGRAGNLRGMDHLTDILHHLKMQVLWNKVPISRVTEEIDEKGELTKETTVKIIEKQIEQFLKF